MSSSHEKTHPAQKPCNCHHDQSIHFSKNENDRADPGEEIGAPFLIRSLAHHITACQNQSNGERGESFFDGMAHGRILSALPELHDKMNEQPSRDPRAKFRHELYEPRQSRCRLAIAGYLRHVDSHG